MARLRIKAISLFTAFAFVVSPFAPAFAASPAPVEAEHGMVVTAQHLATDVGVEILKNGAMPWMRQCGRLRVGSRLSDGGQYRRRRLHDDPAEGRQDDLPRFS
ncbi:hypothetical protein AJ87_27765 [Rhizobium yanglingense]|nr:hypothetical protein AJ87_27765 [Rhizobium yanglingense]